MNREIKFRGKRIDNGKLVYGDFIHGVGDKTGKCYILPLTKIYPSGCNSLDGWEVVPDSIGQYTGLKDKNGKEVFEGDIYRDEFCLDDEHGIDERIYFVCAYVK